MQTVIEERDEREEGFTLIELMVVVLIMGILMAIAIPTFLSTTNGANKSAATSDLTNTLTDAKAYYDSNNQTFGTSAALVKTLNNNEPSFTFTTKAAVNTANNAVSIYVNAAGTEVVLAAQAKGTNDCFYTDDVEQTLATAGPSGNTAPGVYYGSAAGGSSGCAAAAAVKPAPAASGATSAGAWNANQGSGWGI